MLLVETINISPTYNSSTTKKQVNSDGQNRRKPIEKAHFRRIDYWKTPSELGHWKSGSVGDFQWNSDVV